MEIRLNEKLRQNVKFPTAWLRVTGTGGPIVNSKTNMVRVRKIIFLICFALSLGALLVEIDGFWNNYLLDIVFPAFWYLTIRGISQSENASSFLQKLSPTVVFGFLVCLLFTMESGQYFGFYWGTYDPIDFLAYLSVLVPCYLIDILGHRDLEASNSL